MANVANLRSLRRDPSDSSPEVDHLAIWRRQEMRRRNGAQAMMHRFIDEEAQAVRVSMMDSQGETTMATSMGSENTPEYGIDEEGYFLSSRGSILTPESSLTSSAPSNSSSMPALEESHNVTANSTLPLPVPLLRQDAMRQREVREQEEVANQYLMQMAEMREEGRNMMTSMRATAPLIPVSPRSPPRLTSTLKVKDIKIIPETDSESECSGSRTSKEEIQEEQTPSSGVEMEDRSYPSVDDYSSIKSWSPSEFSRSGGIYTPPEKKELPSLLGTASATPEGHLLIDLTMESDGGTSSPVFKKRRTKLRRRSPGVPQLSSQESPKLLEARRKVEEWQEANPSKVKRKISESEALFVDKLHPLEAKQMRPHITKHIIMQMYDSANQQKMEKSKWRQAETSYASSSTLTSPEANQTKTHDDTLNQTFGLRRGKKKCLSESQVEWIKPFVNQSELVDHLEHMEVIPNSSPQGPKFNLRPACHVFNGCPQNLDGTMTLVVKSPEMKVMRPMKGKRTMMMMGGRKLPRETFNLRRWAKRTQRSMRIIKTMTRVNTPYMSLNERAKLDVSIKVQDLRRQWDAISDVRVETIASEIQQIINGYKESLEDKVQRNILLMRDCRDREYWIRLKLDTELDQLILRDSVTRKIKNLIEEKINILETEADMANLETQTIWVARMS